MSIAPHTSAINQVLRHILQAPKLKGRFNVGTFKLPPLMSGCFILVAENTHVQTHLASVYANGLRKFSQGPWPHA